MLPDPCEGLGQRKTKPDRFIPIGLSLLIPFELMGILYTLVRICNIILIFVLALLKQRKMETKAKYYPIGLQNFEKIRIGNYLYVDKTQLIYSLVKGELLFPEPSAPFWKKLAYLDIRSLF